MTRELDKHERKKNLLEEPRNMENRGLGGLFIGGIAAMPREPFDFKAFAADRSTRNSQMSNELGKAAAQAVMLINGGAAAAILSFMKGTQANNVFFALGLMGYAAGVICAAWMMYSLNQVLYGRSEFWQSYFNHEKLGEPYRGIWKNKADIWLGRKNGAFVCSVSCFLIASFCMAIAIYT